MSKIGSCEYCSKEFVVTANHKRFCDRICSNKYTGERNKGRKHTEETRKKVSDGKRGVLPSEETRKKLSIALSKRLIGNTIMKGKKHSEDTKNKMSRSATGKVFSEEHIKNLIESRPRGEDHPSWKGGITSENVLIRKSEEGRKWIRKVFQRDNYTCQKYGTKGDLNAHHIENFSSNIELRFDIFNGITLSKKAHKEFHSIYGVKNNNREQLLEFLDLNKYLIV